MIDSILRTATVTVALVLFFVVGVSAQFSVVSSEPADGSVLVPTLTTVSLTFSAPLDTTALIDPEDDSFLAIETHPEIGDPNPLALDVSPDFLTFTATLQLEEDTRYLIMLTGAKSQSGEMLSAPYVLTFTTGMTLPGGSVAGVITDATPGKAAEGTIAALFPDTPEGGLGSESADAPYAAAIANAAGQYTIPYVAAGTYQAVAAGDNDKDGLIEPESGGDTFGLYDTNSDGLLDPVTVGDGQAVSGIDITVRIPVPVTVQANAARAIAAATSVWPDAVLTSVSAFPLPPDGLAAQWIYIFWSASNTELMALLSIGDQFILFPWPGFGGQVDGSTPLPEGWIDSDAAADIANANGGSDFLAIGWDFVEVTGFAGNVIDILGVVSTAVPPTPLWWVSYYGEGGGQPFPGFMNIYIHALTGDVDPPLAWYAAARENLAVANAAAANWAASAQLVSVESGSIGVHRSGRSSEWRYTYRSNANTAYEITVQAGAVVGEGSINPAFLPSTQSLPANWIDSPDASSTADVQSGDFRNLFNNVRVEAMLAKDIDFNNPTRSVWEFRYWEEVPNGAELTVWVDAETGLVVGTEHSDELPENLRLDQNYPNPFNPSTSISYEVPANGLVRLTVFDLLGREVRTLVDGERAAGRYVVSWDGTDENRRPVSSGIYVYQIEAAGASETRSMTLLR